MRVQQTRRQLPPWAVRELARRRAIERAEDSHLQLKQLCAAGDELLREFLALTNWEHPAAERYRKARAAVEDFAG